MPGESGEMGFEIAYTVREDGDLGTGKILWGGWVGLMLEAGDLGFEVGKLVAEGGHLRAERASGRDRYDERGDGQSEDCCCHDDDKKDAKFHG
jgi:hypothetical protein